MEKGRPSIPLLFYNIVNLMISAHFAKNVRNDQKESFKLHPKK